MRFGTSAVVRVGRGGASEGLRGPMTGLRDAKVNVGRTDTKVRTGADAAAAAANRDPSCQNYDWTQACDRPLAIARTSIAAGQSTEFTLTPCGPYRLGDSMGRVFIVPDDIANLFEVSSIKVCRNDYIEDAAWPMGAFVANGPGITLGCGSVFFPSLPLKVTVKNNSGAAAFFSMLVLGKELALCG